MDTFLIIYLSGFVVAYYFHRYAFRKFMAMQGHDGDRWSAVLMCIMFAFASWATVLVVFVISLIYGVFINIDSKPPKWL